MRKREPVMVIERGEAAGEARDPQVITALARGLDVLRAFRRSDRHLGNLDIARRTGLPKPTVSRITYTLSRLGYLSYDADVARYRLSAGSLALGYTCMGSFGIRDIARPHMQRLADETGLTVALGTLDRHSMVYIEVCRGESLFPVNLEPGSHIRLATSAMGRAYILSQSPAQRAALLGRIAQRQGAAWPQIKAGLDEAMRQMKDYGFVVSVGEWKNEVNAAGIGLRLGINDADFALNCGGPAFLVSPQRLFEEVGPKLAVAARWIEADMGLGLPLKP